MQQSAGGLKPLTPSDSLELRLVHFNLLFYWAVLSETWPPQHCAGPGAV